MCNYQIAPDYRVHCQWTSVLEFCLKAHQTIIQQTLEHVCNTVHVSHIRVFTIPVTLNLVCNTYKNNRLTFWPLKTLHISKQESIYKLLQIIMHCYFLKKMMSHFRCVLKCKKYGNSFLCTKKYKFAALCKQCWNWQKLTLIFPFMGLKILHFMRLLNFNKKIVLFAACRLPHIKGIVSTRRLLWIKWLKFKQKGRLWLDRIM